MVRDRKEALENKTVIIIDGENLKISLSRLGLYLNSLEDFVDFLLEDGDVLTSFSNREGTCVNPVILVASYEIDKQLREKQLERLYRMQRKNKSIVEIVGIDPKVSSKGKIFSCTDSVIAAYIGMALYDKEIKKIIVVSGDGDFLRPLETIGISGKEIDMVGIWGSVSVKLKDFVVQNKGRVITIGDAVPGISLLGKKPVRQRKERQKVKFYTKCLKNRWNEGRKRECY